MQLGQPMRKRERQERDWRARCSFAFAEDRISVFEASARGKTGPVFIIGSLSIVAAVAAAARARLHTIASGIELLSI